MEHHHERHDKADRADDEAEEVVQPLVHVLLCSSLCDEHARERAEDDQRKQGEHEFVYQFHVPLYGQRCGNVAKSFQQDTNLRLRLTGAAI